MEIAELSNLPQAILDNARDLATKLRADVEQQRKANESGGIARQRELCQLAYRILNLVDRIPSTTEENMTQYLSFLQEKFVKNLQIKES